MISAAEIEQAYRDHGWHVYRRSLAILRDPAEAADVCQEVFVRLLERHEEIRDRGKLTAWIFQVTTNRCIDRLRLRKDHDPTRLECLAGNGATDEQAALRELALRVLRGVTAGDQELAVLRFVDGLTLEELETVSGLTRKTVSRRLERFQRQARELLREVAP